MNERQSCKRVGEQQRAVRRVGSLLFAISLAALKRGGREGRELEGKEEKLEVGKGRRMDVAMREGEEQTGVRFIIELVFSTCTHHCTYYDRLIPVC